MIKYKQNKEPIMKLTILTVLTRFFIVTIFETNKQTNKK